MHKLKEAKAIVFDLDGTLLESNLDFAMLRAVTGCPQGKDILEYVETLSEPDQASANALIKQHEIEDARCASWIKGARGFLNLLMGNKTPVAIVTRNCREAVSIKLENNQVPIQRVVTREDGPAKPDPSTLLLLSKEWKLPPSDIVYIGDYLYDVQAAVNAGMLSGLFAPDGIPYYAHLADFVFSDYVELGRVFVK